MGTACKKLRASNKANVINARADVSDIGWFLFFTTADYQTVRVSKVVLDRKIRVFVTFLTLLNLDFILTMFIGYKSPYIFVRILEMLMFLQACLSAFLTCGRRKVTDMNGRYRGGGISRIRITVVITASSLLSFLIFTASAQASAIDGFWQHPDDPVWIEIKVAAGTGVAIRNDEQPETVGFHVVKDLIASGKAGAWEGEVFVPQLDKYKNVGITLPDEQTLRMTVKFGFIRRSVEWSRVGSVDEVNSK